MEKIIADVLKALDGVGERFYRYRHIYFDNGNLVDTKQVKKLERRFMIEFSSQFSRGFQSKGLYEKLEYDFEVPKQFMWGENPNSSIRRTWETLNSSRRDVDMIEYFTTEPDFLVHRGEDNMLPDNQKLIIEAKVNPRTSKGGVFKDIFHTFIYSNVYDFQCSVMLLVNFEKERWLEYFYEYYNSGYYCGRLENYSKVYVIFKPSFHSEAEVHSVADILKIDTDGDLCPICESPMEHRMARRGINAGNYFLGCIKFPDCRGTRNIT
ncbi:topoisomerase DNA-binding C4 zinc finger domain-containing protein [Vibrio fluvialis]|nr:topoisomerase DNA-binding C4 zinc finger domain-containing protein [Vibrio fluvialis]